MSRPRYRLLRDPETGHWSLVTGYARYENGEVVESGKVLDRAPTRSDVEGYVRIRAEEADERADRLRAGAEEARAEDNVDEAFDLEAAAKHEERESYALNALLREYARIDRLDDEEIRVEVEGGIRDRQRAEALVLRAIPGTRLRRKRAEDVEAVVESYRPYADVYADRGLGL